MRPKTISPIPLKQGILMLVALILAFLFFTPRFIEYSDNHVIRAVPVLLAFFGVPILVVIFLMQKRGGFKLYFILYAFLALVATTTTSAFIHYKATNIELEKTGVWGKAVVTAKKQLTQLGTKRWQIKCTYLANHQRYETLFVDDHNNNYHLGDTLDIIYSKDFPKMYRLEKVY